MLATVPVTAPVLSDGVVTLRSHEPADIADMIGMCTDPETVAWTDVPRPYRAEHAEGWVARGAPAGWRDGTACRWAIETTDERTGRPRFAGNVDLRLAPPPDVGFALAPWARGRGIMTRAVRLMTGWAFDVAGVPVVHWSAHAGNLASWRVAHACGFTFHGSRPLAVVQQDRLHDSWCAALRPGVDRHTPRTTWWPTPILDGETVRLRPLADRDAPRIAEACADPRTRHWLPHMPHPSTEGAAREWMRRCALESSLGQRVTWAVADPADDSLLASIGIFRLDDEDSPTGSEIGYWAHPDARGRGVVGAAAELVLDHAFSPRDAGGLGRHRVQLGAGWANRASRGVAERAGFRLVGNHRRDHVLGDGSLSDSAWYDLLATDRP